MSKAARHLGVVGNTSVPVDSSSEARSLISPNTDVLMIGGLSVAMFAFASVMVEPNSPSATLGWTVYYLSFAVNFPHFLVSYHMLYGDFGKNILKEPKFFWAAVIAPAILLLTLIGGIVSGQASVLGYLANAMYFFVGWHYVKQIFGGVVVSNALAKYFYNSTERLVMKSNLFSLWAISWISQNIGMRTQALEGVPYQSLNFPQYLQALAYWAVGLTAMAVVVAHVMKYIREGKAPTLPAIFCFAAIYVWFIPALYHPMYFHLIPFFHSLQYLLFVIAFRRNKAMSLAGGSVSRPEQRRAFLAKFYGYLGGAVASGAIFLFFLPKWLDSQNFSMPGYFGPTVMMFCFTVFINVHHYFIDNVMWRGNNPEMRKHLFGA